MLRGETTIGKVLARCPAGTEPIRARLRLSHLFAGADLAPRGFPPRAVLVIRRARAASSVALTPGLSLSSRAALEREVREQVSTLWRRAARPVRGRVPAGAEAVLFEDEGEWLAALGLAFTRREVWSHWCWRGWHDASATAAPSRALVRAWAESPRFMPAALMRLAGWGEAARVLSSLQPEETGALLYALRAEFQLSSAPHVSSTQDKRAATRGDEQSEARAGGRSATDDEQTSFNASGRGGGTAGQDRLDESASGRVSAQTSGEAPPPWRRWLPADGGACERLHTTSRSLLSFAAALFHAPTLARSRHFAAEVFSFNETRDAPARPTTDAPRTHADSPSSTRERRADNGCAVEARRADERPRGAAHDAAAARDDDARDTSSKLSPDADAAPRPALRSDDADQSFESAATRPARSDDAGESKRESVTSVRDDVEAEDVSTAAADAAPWAGLDGCETRLGGALFLLNLLVGLRLPECFDEAYALSEHITGWGLTELLARDLLGERFAEFEDDPLWGALAHLDGRAAGEPPAAGLRVGHTYRAPARWLKLFASREGEDVWRAGVDEETLVINHAAGFPVAVLPLEGRDAAALAAQVADEYRAHGLSVSLSLSARGGSPTMREGVRSGWRRWMSWTFPFLKYALCRSLADAGGEEEDEAAARVLIVRRGRLYCTATHVDLMLELSGLSFEARRAGLDASPGWVRDLLRVVAFHYE